MSERPGTTTEPEPATHADDAAQAARSAGANLLSLLAYAMTPVYQAVVARLFGPALYGLYAVASGVLEIFTCVAMGGMDLAILRNIARARARGDREGTRAAIGTAIRSVLAMGVLVATGVWLFSGPLARLARKPEIETLLGALAPALVFSALSIVVITATLAAKRARYNLVVRGVLQPLTMLGLALLGTVYLGASATTLVIAHLSGAIFTLALSLWACRRVFGEGLFAQAWRAPFDAQLWRVSWLLGASEIALLVLQRADLVILGIYVSDKQLGLYAGAEYLSRVVMTTRSVFDYVACPVLAEAHQSGDPQRVAYNLRLLTRWVLLLALPTASLFFVFPSEVLSILGPEFRDAAGVLLVLATAQLIHGALGLSGWVLAMGRSPRLSLINSAVAAAMNISANLLLVPTHGLMGAAVAAVVGAGVLRGLEVAEVWWLERVHCFGMGFVKALVAGGVSLLAQIALASMIPQGGVLRVVVVSALGFVAFGFALLLLGANDERALLARIPGLRWLGRRR